jgi:putative membrane protein
LTLLQRLEFYICVYEFADQAPYFYTCGACYIAVLVTAYILPGVYIKDFLTGVIVAIVLGCLNVVVKPLMILFSLPAVIFTFGLFLLVINTLVILITDKLVDGFSVGGFWKALVFSIVLWIVTSIFNVIQAKDEQEE